MNRERATSLINELFENWYSCLIRYALRTTRSFEVAEEVVQDTFVEFYVAQVRGEVIHNPKAWMLTVVRREISDYRQKNPHYESLDAAEFLTTRDISPVDRAFEVDDITRYFTVLSKREEEVLLLRLQALKYREIAQSLGIRPGSVASLLARALRKLQAAAVSDGNHHSVIREAHAAKTLR